MMTNCPTCHRSISSHARFCPHCGDDFVRYRKSWLQGRLFLWTALFFTFISLVCVFATIQAHVSPAPYTTPQEAQQWATESLRGGLLVWVLTALFWVCAFLSRGKPGIQP